MTAEAPSRVPVLSDLGETVEADRYAARLRPRDEACRRVIGRGYLHTAQIECPFWMIVPHLHVSHVHA